MRKVRENIIVLNGGVAAEDIFIYSLDGGMESLNPAINTNDLVFYDPRTNRTISNGDTIADVPKLGIAKAIDPQGLGYPTRLQKAYGGFVDGRALQNFTSEPPKCGCNQVVDFYGDCTNYGTQYSVTIETRGDRTLDYNLWNFWEKETFTVNLKNFSCDSCVSGVDEKQVFCALAKQVNSHERTVSDKKAGAFRRRALKQQAKVRKFKAYPILGNDYEWTISHSSTACENCNQMTGIGGVKIDGTDYTFNGTTIAGSPTLSLKGKQNQIADRINNAFKTAGVEGSAVVKQQIYGGGQPCCDFQILVNSCVTVDLLDGNGAVLSGKVTTNPFSAVTTTANCKGCDPDESWTPTAGLRVVALGMEIDCDCTNPVDRKAWYHREVRIHSQLQERKWGRFATKVVQPVVIPDNLGVQWKKRMLDADHGGPGRDYDPWTVDHAGLYATPRKGTAFTEATKGINCTDLYCSLVFTHNLDFFEKSVTGTKNAAKGRTVLLMPNDDPNNIYATLQARLDPWLASVENGNFGPISCTADADQVETTALTDLAATGTFTFTANAAGGDAAVGTLTMTGNALDTETVVIGGKTYTFLATLVPGDGNVHIGANASDSLDNLIAAINLGAGAGTDYASETTANTDVSAAAGAGDTMDLTALATGSAGNSITTTETLTNGSFGGGTLSGGSDSADGDTFTIGAKTYLMQSTLTNVDGNIKVGATTEDTVNNIVAAINGGPGSGTAYAAAMTTNTQVTATKLSATSFKVTAKTAGTAGNSIATTETSDVASWGAATLQGGLDQYDAGTGLPQSDTGN